MTFEELTMGMKQWKRNDDGKAMGKPNSIVVEASKGILIASNRADHFTETIESGYS
jgi:hypothetical protein